MPPATLTTSPAFAASTACWIVENLRVPPGEWVFPPMVTFSIPISVSSRDAGETDGPVTGGALLEERPRPRTRPRRCRRRRRSRPDRRRPRDVVAGIAVQKAHRPRPRRRGCRRRLRRRRSRCRPFRSGDRRRPGWIDHEHVSGRPCCRSRWADRWRARRDRPCHGPRPRLRRCRIAHDRSRCRTLPSWCWKTSSDRTGGEAVGRGHSRHGVVVDLRAVLNAMGEDPGRERIVAGVTDPADRVARDCPVTPSPRSFRSGRWPRSTPIRDGVVAERHVGLTNNEMPPFWKSLMIA